MRCNVTVPVIIICLYVIIYRTQELKVEYVCILHVYYILLIIISSNIQGTMESMLSGAICGLIYHTFAGQPLTIVGATGPMLVFESILYQLCG